MRTTRLYDTEYRTSASTTASSDYALRKAGRFSRTATMYASSEQSAISASSSRRWLRKISRRASLSAAWVRQN